jgi:hypothetical protein
LIFPFHTQSNKSSLPIQILSACLREEPFCF